MVPVVTVAVFVAGRFIVLSTFATNVFNTSEFPTSDGFPLFLRVSSLSVVDEFLAEFYGCLLPPSFSEVFIASLDFRCL